MAPTMPRTLDDLVQETLGVQTLTILRLQADNEAMKAKIAALETPPPDPPKD